MTTCVVMIAQYITFSMTTCVVMIAVNWLISKQSIFCKTKLFLIVSGRHEKYNFVQESFNLQGIFNDISEQDTSILHCKHKHMMKSGVPPDRVGVLYCLLHIEFHCFTSSSFMQVHVIKYGIFKLA